MIYVLFFGFCVINTGRFWLSFLSWSYLVNLSLMLRCTTSIVLLWFLILCNISLGWFRKIPLSISITWISILRFFTCSIVIIIIVWSIVWIVSWSVILIFSVPIVWKIYVSIAWGVSRTIVWMISVSGAWVWTLSIIIWVVASIWIWSFIYFVRNVVIFFDLEIFHEIYIYSLVVV